jgi:hypothetical protein
MHDVGPAVYSPDVLPKEVKGDLSQYGCCLARDSNPVSIKYQTRHITAWANVLGGQFNLRSFCMSIGYWHTLLEMWRSFFVNASGSQKLFLCSYTIKNGSSFVRKPVMRDCLAEQCIVCRIQGDCLVLCEIPYTCRNLTVFEQQLEQNGCNLPSKISLW